MDVYYLGAGASFGTLPLMAGMKSALENYLGKLSNPEYTGIVPDDVTDELRSNVISILEKLPEYRTIDTYIKELTDDPGTYTRVKNTLIAAFYFWEYTGKANAKYQSLIANYIHKRVNDAPVLKRPLHIVSWNYDNEVERSIGKYFAYADFGLIYEGLLYSHHIGAGEKDKALVHLYKLNGSASFVNEAKIFGPSFYEELTIDKATQKSIGLYQNLKMKAYQGFMRFSWDEYPEKKQLIRNVKNILERCDHLIIIGYSFPSFNTDVDSELLKSLNQSARITIQCAEHNLQVKSKLTRMLNLGRHSENRIYLDDSKDDFSMPIPNIDDVSEFKIEIKLQTVTTNRIDDSSEITSVDILFDCICNSPSPVFVLEIKMKIPNNIDGFPPPVHTISESFSPRKGWYYFNDRRFSISNFHTETFKVTNQSVLKAIEKGELPEIQIIVKTIEYGEIKSNFLEIWNPTKLIK